MSAKLLRNNAVLAACALLVGIAGCLSAQGDEEHVEHHVPEHRPPSYAAAVEQLRQRHRKIADAFQSGEIGSLKHDLAEMDDIVGWLPELAADGPMKKPAWDQVQVASQKLAVIYKGATACLTASPRGRWPDTHRAADALIETLAKQIPPLDELP
jgi:hypothetical protein